MTGPVTSAIAFPLQSGYKALVANGLKTKNVTITGTCAGSGSMTISPATTAATFEGVNGFTSASTVAMNFTNCTPASAVATTIGYYDTNYVPLGQSITGTSYIVYSRPFSIPTSVTVGSTGAIGTAIQYQDNTKSRAFGTLEFTYLIEPDTVTTAIVNLIEKSYEPPCKGPSVCVVFLTSTPPSSLSLAWTGQSRYRIDALGTLTPLSINIQYANGQTRILTYN